MNYTVTKYPSVSGCTMFIVVRTCVGVCIIVCIVCCAICEGSCAQWAIAKSNSVVGSFNCVGLCGFHDQMIFSE